MIRCLTTNRDKLSAVCRTTMFDAEVRFSENIDFQYPMKTACVKELQMFCKDVPHGEARAIRCLQVSGESSVGSVGTPSYRQQQASLPCCGVLVRHAHCATQLSRLAC